MATVDTTATFVVAARMVVLLTVYWVVMVVQRGPKVSREAMLGLATHAVVM